MKQVMQSLKSGTIEVPEVPCPSVGRGCVLIRSCRTLVSAGTERMLIEFGKAGWLQKARQQPDKVRLAFEKIKTDGIVSTVVSVLNKLDQPLPLGYCNVGIVVEVGEGVQGYGIGDRVASNGRHAEMVAVPVNLCAKIPPAVSDDEAVFTVMGAIGLQGIRLVQPTLGESVVVTGLGLIGLLTVQLLRAHGCRVLGIDFDAGKLALAKQFGAEVVDLSSGEDPVATAKVFSRGRGVDAVIITASTKSSEPVHQAALMCRKRGRIVLVGVAGLKLSRADFFAKELSFQVSCSYGPGRYDSNYEERGLDYPFGYVRWTEQRNFEAILDMMCEQRLDVKPLISHRFAITEAAQAYELVAGGEPSLGILLRFPCEAPTPDMARLRRPTVAVHPSAASAGETSGRKQVAVAFIGAGNYATTVLIPAFKATGARMKTIASSGGVSGFHAARKFGFEETSTDDGSVFADADVEAVVITTRHNTHARLVQEALDGGKHVFVEKPLALSLDQLVTVQTAQERGALAGKPCLLMVGFNRRFAIHVQKIKSLLAGVNGPKAFVMTVNAGAIPTGHWTQDLATGGGRIVGEACHFIDLLRFLAGASITDHGARKLETGAGDTATLELKFADGSIGTIHYFANGSRAFPKERLEVFGGGRILQLDNYRKLTGFGWPEFRKMNLWRQDKGQKACARAFVAAVERGGAPPIPLDELIEVSRISIEVAEALRSRSG